MIVCDRHRFVFLQVPQTGGTALGRTLVKHYGGSSVLPQHQTLAQAHRQLGPRISGYRVVATVRNPLQQIVSSYYKIERDHNGQLSRGASGEISLSRARIAQYHFIKAGGDFESWFRRYQRGVFAPRWVASQRAADILIRFEDLDADFTRFLEESGLEVRAVPLRVNETDRPTVSLDDLYSLAVREMAMGACGPFMREFGYPTPDGWPEPRSRWAQMQYRFVPATKDQLRRFGLHQRLGFALGRLKRSFPVTR